MTDLFRQLGEKHGSIDRAASLKTQALDAQQNERHVECLQRWPRIVEAMRTLIAAYNEGAGVAVLTFLEDSERRGVTLESVRRGRGSLVMTLDGADVCVRTRDSETDASHGVRWVSLSRTDEQAAEYLLRNWIEQI